MLNTDMLLEAMSGIREEYITEAQSVLGYGEARPVKSHKKLWRTVLLAAVLAALLIVTAYASGWFTLRAREAEPGEVITVGVVNGVLIQWKNMELVFEFTGPSECPVIEFRPNYLPIEPSKGCKESFCREGWYTNLYVWDTDPATWPKDMPAYDSLHFFNPFGIEVYYSAQFTEGGSAILNHTPDKISETVINGCKAMKFHASREANNFRSDYNYLILFSEDEGYMIVISGHADMEIMEMIAENLEIRETGETVCYDDFESHNVFIDMTIG